MRWLQIAMLAIGAQAASAQTIHHGFIWLEGPQGVLQPNTTDTVDGWARWESPIFIQGTSAVAGSGFDMICTLGSGTQIAGIGHVVFSEWALTFGRYDAIQGSSILRVSGGQVPVPFGATPRMDLRNPIPMFTFEFTTGNGPVGDFSFAPMNPATLGGLSFYPVRTDGYQVVASNDPGTALHLTGWDYVVPAPAGAGVLAVGICALSRRRR